MKRLFFLILLCLALSNGWPSVTAQQTTFDIRRYGARCNGSTNDATALAAANTAATVNGGSILIPGNCAIATNTTLDGDVALEFGSAGKLSIATGVTVTVGGSIVAPTNQQIFALTGTGAISFTKSSVVRPRWWGAVGDNSTDDTAEIQAAVDSLATVGVVDFGAGRFLVTGSINVTKPIILQGAGGSQGGGGFFGTQIRGTISGYIINATLAGTWTGFSIQQIYIANSHATGGGVYLENVNGPSTISHTKVDAYRAITMSTNTFSVLISDVSCTGTASPSGSWGIVINGHTTLVSVDIVGYENGIRVGGPGVVIVGGRNEVNKTALVIGKDASGSPIAAAAFSLTGATYEANDTAIENLSGTGYSINGVSIQGSVNAPSGQSVSGLTTSTENYGFISGLTTSGTFSAYSVSGKGYATFQNCNVGSNALGGQWNITRPQTCNFINSNYYPVATGSAISNLSATQIVRSIGAKDEIRGVAEGKNLRGIDVAVGSGVSFVDITFPNLSAGQAALNTATATGSGSTLPPGTYYYIATLVNEIGETTATGEKTVTTTGTQQVDLTFFGFSAAQKQWKRRIYRGTATGVYDGYFDHSFESSATFSDTGQAFTGKRTPPTVEGASGTEPNANYAVAVSSAWSTTYYISNKATSGFRINFGTAPGSSSTLDWILIR